MKGRSQAKPHTSKSLWGARLAWVASLAALALSLWLVSRAYQRAGEAGPEMAAPRALPTTEATPWPSDAEQESDELTREERRVLQDLIDRRASGKEQR